MYLAGNLKFLREQIGKTQQELANLFGVEQKTMRGTPNHDGSGQFNVLSEMFADVPNVHVVITPQVISFDDVDIAVLPGFDGT